MRDDIRSVRPMRAAGSGAWVALFSAIVSLGAIETGMSIWAPQWPLPEKRWVAFSRGIGYCYPSNPDSYFRIDLRKGEDVNGRYGFSLSPEEIERLRVSAPFCVGSDRAARKRGFYPGRRRGAILLGDSFAYGEGLRDEDSPAFLLGAAFENFNFRSFASPGDSARRIRMKLGSILRSEKERTFIYYYNINDLRLSGDFRRRKRSLVDDFQNLKWSRSEGLSGSLPLIGRSQLYLLAAKALASLRSTRRTISFYREAYFSPENREQVERTHRDLLEMGGDIRKAGGSLTVVIFPLMYKDARGNYPFSGIHESLMSFCSKSGLNCIDGRGAFRGIRSMDGMIVHPIDRHPGAEAQKRMAAFLAGRPAMRDFKR